jgi:lysophospholipase L1-like esterase
MASLHVKPTVGKCALVTRDPNAIKAIGAAVASRLLGRYGKKMKTASPQEPKMLVEFPRWIALAVIVGSSLLVAPASAVASSAHATGPNYYLSLGDSLAEGWQPVPADGSATLDGYSNQIATDLASDIPLTLENFACGGATTWTLLNAMSCPAGDQANNGVAYPFATQVAAAVAFAQAHPGQVKLITISIAANDYSQCLADASPVPCVKSTLGSIKANIETIAHDLRAAVGPSGTIIAITDITNDIQHYLTGRTGRTSAKEWLNEFKTQIVPTLQKAYAPSKVTLVNIISDIGSYISWNREVRYPPYG